MKTTSPSPNLSRLTVRSVLVGLICVVLICAITPYNNMYLDGTLLAGNHFPIAGMFLLTAIILFGNAFLLKIQHRRYALSAGELMVIWGMIIVSAGIPYSGLMRYLIPLLVAPIFFASPENEWRELYHPYLSDWLVVTEPRAVRGFYEGLPGESIPWEAWVKPLFSWGLFALLVYFVMLCMCVLLRRQWVERERYTFPLVQLPAEIAQSPQNGSLINNFFKNRAVWIGFAVPVFLHTLNGLHDYFTELPSIPTVFRLSDYFTEKPWSALSWGPSLRFKVFPSVVGITYLLTLDVAFSFWFFFLLNKLEQVSLFAIGSKWTGSSFALRQGMGAYLALMVAMIWTSRVHLKEVVQKTFQRRKLIDDTNEMLPYRWATIGLIGGFVGLTLLCILVGMTLWVAAGVLLMFFIISHGLTWMVANGGLLYVKQTFRPSDYLVAVVGSKGISQGDWTLLCFQDGMMRDTREMLMPNLMNAMRLPDFVGLRRRSMFWAIAIAVLTTLAVSAYAFIHLTYAKGGLSLEGYAYITAAVRPFNQFSRHFISPSEVDIVEISTIGGGAGVMFFLMYMRRQFIWWRLHPIGYLMHLSGASGEMWGSIFLGWILKYLILKYGGIGGYRRFRPAFLGMVLGESLIGGVWVIVGLFTGIGYRMLPG